MLAYPIDEAESMLTEKLRAAEASLSNCEEDLEFLREQITVSNILASMHCWLISLNLSVTKSFSLRLSKNSVHLGSSTRPMTQFPTKSTTDNHTARLLK